jgi:hypothetical protein
MFYQKDANLKSDLLAVESWKRLREKDEEGGSGHATMTTNFKVGSLQENFIFIPC